MKDCIIGFKTTDEMKEQLKALADEKDVSISHIIREYIKMGLAQEGRK